MEEKKSMDRGIYDFFTHTNANLSLLHTERGKKEHNIRTYFSLIPVSQIRSVFLLLFPEKQLPLDNEGGQNKAINQ